MATKEQIEGFKALFNFDQSRELQVGVEQECHLMRDGQILPITPEIIRAGVSERHTYELSACQLESRTNPCRIEQLPDELTINERELQELEQRHNFTRSYVPVAPVSMPLDVYPDPDGRYHAIASKLSHRILAAACWVIGTHIHVGMPNVEHAIRVYNKVIDHHFMWMLEETMSISSERIELYKLMAGKNWLSNPIDTRNDKHVLQGTRDSEQAAWGWLYRDAVTRSYANNPRDNWALIRVSRHGTIEFRLFPATNDHQQILRWARICHCICHSSLEQEREQDKYWQKIYRTPHNGW